MLRLPLPPLPLSSPASATYTCRQTQHEGPPILSQSRGVGIGGGGGGGDARGGDAARANPGSISRDRRMLVLRKDTGHTTRGVEKWHKGGGGAIAEGVDYLEPGLGGVTENHRNPFLAGRTALCHKLGISMALVGRRVASRLGGGWRSFALAKGLTDTAGSCCSSLPRPALAATSSSSPLRWVPPRVLLGRTISSTGVWRTALYAVSFSDDCDRSTTYSAPVAVGLLLIWSRNCNFQIKRRDGVIGAAAVSRLFGRCCLQ